MEGGFLEFEDGGELVISGSHTTEVLQPIEVLECAETVEGQVHLLQELVLSDALNGSLGTCIAGSRLWVQVKSRKAKVDPQAVLPKSPRWSLRSSCCSSGEMTTASVSDSSSTVGVAKLVV